MAGIRGKDTKPEMIVRKGLHARGFRYRLHSRDLPGRPDIVLPKYRAVIFVHGCFWHGHDCHRFSIPSSSRDFWAEKVTANRARDLVTTDALSFMGWRQAMIWECALKGRARLNFEEVMLTCERWLWSKTRMLEIRGE